MCDSCEEKLIECKVCGKKFKRITNTHLKSHGMTMAEYMMKYPDAEIDAPGLAYSRVEHLRGVSYIDYYGPEKGKEMHKARRSSAEQQMLDEDQIKARQVSRKSGTSWEDSREKALERADHECERCGSDKNLDVHHIKGSANHGMLADNSLDNLMVLCRKCHMKLHHSEYEDKFKYHGNARIQRGMVEALRGLSQAYGLDLTDENLKGTPERIARSWMEIFSGVHNTQEKVDSILSTGFPSEGYGDMIIVDDIRTYSMCPHHFLPIEYDIAIAYIPSNEGNVLGLSKLPRLADVLSKRPVMQETVTDDIADALMRIKPRGVAVLVKGIHYCMKMRGIKSHTGLTVTSAMRGVFMDEINTRQEFMNLIKG